MLKQFRALRAPLMIGVLAGALAACGGGGGGGGSAPPPTGGGGGGGGGGGSTDPLGPIQSVEQEQDRLFESLGLGVIEPGYDAMAVDSEALKAAMADYCAAPTADLSAVQDAWRAAMLSWNRISIVRFGPVEADNRRLRIQFFPDPNDAVLNNVSSLLNGTQTITEAVVAGSPVGAQGLPAIEYLLFDLGGLDDATDGPRRCELAVAVTENYDTMADELATAWDGSGQLMADFTSASGQFMDRAEVLTAVLESLAQDVEFVADEKVTRPQQTGPLTTESFRSEHSVENLIANTEAIRAWLDRGPADTDYGFRDYLVRAHDSEAISNQLNAELADAEAGLVALNDSLESILMGTGTGDIDIIRTSLQDLADVFIDAAVAADVNLGFSNQDGD
ncbi:MAG: imelysin family protein [Pseudomonadota bacterium]